MRTTGWLVAIVVASALGLGAPASAAAGVGDLDSGYGIGGIVSTHNDEPEQAGGRYSTQDQLPVGVQPSGKPIIAGRVQTYDCSSGTCIYRYPYVVERLGSNGNLDPSFGSAGITQIDETGLSFQVDQAVLQADGKVLLVGADSFQADRLVVIRLTAGGGPDSSFGANGVAEITTPTGSYVGSTHVASLPSGDVVAGINSEDYATGQSTLTIVRLDQGGTPEPDFGSGGFVTEPGGRYNYFESMLADSQGRILVVEVRDDPVNDFENDPVVIRYLGDGTRDPAYGDSGEAKLPGEGSLFAADAVTPAGGIVRLETYSTGELTRLISVTPAGAFDRGFGKNGYVDLDPGAIVKHRRPQVPRINGLAVQSDGRILLGGAQHLLGGSLLTLGRLLDDGSVDRGFGKKGYSKIYATPRIEDAGVIALPGARILLAGGDPGAKIVSAKYRDDPGAGDDADADRVPDTEDLCPDRFARSPDGCLHHRLSLTLDLARDGGSASGILSSEYTQCMQRVTIGVFVQTAGRDPRIAHKVVYRGEIEDRQVGYTVRLPHSPVGRRYARVRRSLDPVFGVCRGVRSRLVEAR